MIDYLVLKNELILDRSGVGYSGWISKGNDVWCANVLNATSGNGAAKVYRTDLAVEEVVKNIASGNFIALNAVQLAKMQFLFVRGTLDVTDPLVRANFLGIFSGMLPTISGITAVCTKMGSRAEVLFGTGTQISPTDVAGALRQTSG